MSRTIKDLKSYPKKKSEVLKDLSTLCEKVNVFGLPFSQLCEVIALSEILSNKSIIEKLSKSFDNITFHKGKGPDILFSNKKSNKELTIEIKGSLLKKDYMNKGKYRNAKNVKFWGNGVKQKDFSSETGALEGDILILVCCGEEDKKEINEETIWDFIVFDNEDIQKLEPKSTVFFPAYCITSMVNNSQSFFTDEYNGLHKGLVQLIKFKYTEDEVLNKQVRNDFLKVWKDIDCFLYQKEHKQIVDTIWNKAEINKWDKLFIGPEKKKSGKFRLVNLIQNYKCGIISPPNNQTDKTNCVNCQKMIIK